MLLLFDACNDSGVLRSVLLVMNIVKLFCIIAPISLLVSVVVDISKNVFSASMTAASKLATTIVKRGIACILIFFVPVIVQGLFTLIGDMGVEYAKCISNANTDYIEKLEALERENLYKENTVTSKSSTTTDSKKKSASKEKKSEEFYLDKDLIVLGHFNGNKISKKKIVIKNKSGKKLSNKKFVFKVSKPIAEISGNGKIVAKFAGSAKVTVYPKNDPSNKKKFKLSILKATYTKVVTRSKIRAYNLKTGKKEIIPNGAEGIYNGAAMMLPTAANPKFYYPGDTLKWNGNYYSIPYANVKPKGYYVSKPYSSEVAEEFVNSNKFSSNTKYLFWVSQGSEMNYYFKFVKGKWKLQDQFEINTGDVLGLNARYNGGNCNGTTSDPVFAHGLGSCNTFGGNKVDARRLDSYWKGSWVGMHYVIFNHKDNGGGFGAWHEGYSAPREPKSHGCVRHRSSVMIWIRDNISKFGSSRVINF